MSLYHTFIGWDGTFYSYNQIIRIKWRTLSRFKSKTSFIYNTILIQLQSNPVRKEKIIDIFYTKYTEHD